MYKSIKTFFKIPSKSSFFLFFIFLIIIIPPITIGIVSYYQIKKKIDSNILSRRESIAYLSANILKEKFDRLTDLGLSFTTRYSFQVLASQNRWKEVQEVIKDIPEVFPYIDRALVTNIKGELTTNGLSEEYRAGENLSDKEWFKKVIQNEQPYISGVYTRTIIPNYKVFALAIPILNVQAKYQKGFVYGVPKFSGILVLQVRMSTFTEWIKDIQVGEKGFVYVVDQNGYIAAHPKYDSINKIINYSGVESVQKALNNQSGIETIYNNIEKDARLEAYFSIPQHNWCVIATLAKKDMLKEVNKDLSMLFILNAFILLSSLGFAYYIIKTLKKQYITESLLSQRAERLSQLNEQLEKFAYVASHDLQEPLRTVTSYVQLLQRKYKDKLDKNADEYIKIAVEGSLKMKSIINDLLNYSMIDIEREELEQINSGLVLEKVIHALDDYIKENNAIIKISPSLDKMPIVLAVERQLTVLLQHLLINAIKFKRKEVSPRISLNIIEKITSAEEKFTEWEFSIKDNGIGIAPEYHDKIFVIFQRLHPGDIYQGTGIGLAICKKIVEKCGGEIWLKSEPGKGSTFYFTLKGAKKNDL